SLSTSTTDIVHTNAAAATGPYEDFHSLDITPDGYSIVFIANTNGNNSTCAQLWDASTGNSTLVSGDLNNHVPAGSTCDWPTIDPSGRFVVFQSSAANITTNVVVGDYHLYRRDLQAGVTTLLDVDTNGVGSTVSPGAVPSMSANGRLVAFDC